VIRTPENGTRIVLISVWDIHFRTRLYTAPEFRSFESDVFSLGLILSEPLTGKPAFSEKFSKQRVMYEIIFKKARPEIPVFIFPEMNVCLQTRGNIPHFKAFCFGWKQLDSTLFPG
jgi:serine/threonine protein kinase